MPELKANKSFNPFLYYYHLTESSSCELDDSNICTIFLTNPNTINICSCCFSVLIILIKKPSNSPNNKAQSSLFV